MQAVCQRALQKCNRFQLFRPATKGSIRTLQGAQHRQQLKLMFMQIVELERRAAAQGTATRASAYSSWANLDVAPEDMYFLDSRGDRNNLVYGGLYRADVAAYHRADPCGVAKGAMHHGGRHIQRYIHSTPLPLWTPTFSPLPMKDSLTPPFPFQLCLPKTPSCPLPFPFSRLPHLAAPSFWTCSVKPERDFPQSSWIFNSLLH